MLPGTESRGLEQFWQISKTRRGVSLALDLNLLLQIDHSNARRLWLELSLTRRRNTDGWRFATPAANSTGILPDPARG